LVRFVLAPTCWLGTGQGCSERSGAPDLKTGPHSRAAAGAAAWNWSSRALSWTILVDPAVVDVAGVDLLDITGKPHGGDVVAGRAPGKFSTSVVFMSAPPAVTAPSKSKGA